MFVIYQGTEGDTELLSFEEETLAEVEAIAVDFITTMGLLKEANESDLDNLDLAFAINTDDHEDIFPDAEANTGETFIEWLADNGKAALLTNVVVVGDPS